MNLQPADIIRFAALVGGFLLCALGALLMWLGVGADGAVNIKSAILSGSIQTGSAGLFTLFFGFGIIIFVLGSLNAKSSNTDFHHGLRKSKVKHIAQAFWVVLGAFLLTVTLGSLGYGAGFNGASFFLGFFLTFIGAAYVVQLQNE